MRFQFQILTSFVLSLLLFTACSKKDEIIDAPIDPNAKPEIGNGIDEEDLDTYAGDIGILFSLRAIAQYGYQPRKLKIDVGAREGNYDQTIELNQLTLIGQIKLPLEELSEAAAAELREGVSIKVEVLDQNNRVIKIERYSNKSFKSDPSLLVINTDGLEDRNIAVDIKMGIPYYIQLVDKDGNPTTNSLTLKDEQFYNPFPLNRWETRSILTVGKNHQFNGEEGRSIFLFRPLDAIENGFVIYNPTVGKVLENLGIPGLPSFKHITAYYSKDRYNSWSESQILQYPSLTFIIEKEANGIYTMKSKDGSGRIFDEPIIGLTGENNAQEDVDDRIVRFRLIAMDVLWDFESVSTEYFEPILPKASTSFGFNNTLINCSVGTMVQNIETAFSETVEQTTGWEESFSISSSTQQSLTISAGLEVEGTFFGNGASYSAEISGTVSTTNTATESSSEWGSISKAKSESVFTNRSITVPPKSATLVVDVFQSYDDVKVHFVQRIRVRARDANASQGNPELSGKEILSLINFSRFNGVVTKVETDYVELSVKGTTTIGKWIVDKSEANDVDPECD